MSDTIVPVSSKTHKNTKIRTDLGYKHASAWHLCAITLPEIDHVVSNYPVTFIADPEHGKLRAVAILGLEAGRNLFVGEAGGRPVWNATYVPQVIQRYPFSLGAGEDLPLLIDQSSDIISETEGQPLFDDDGKITPYLDAVRKMFVALSTGQEETAICLEQLDTLGLLKDLTLVFTLQSGKKHTMTGLKAADRQLLKALNEKDTAALNATGALMFAYLASSSLSQVTRLVQLANVNAQDPIVSVNIEQPNVTAEESPKS